MPNTPGDDAPTIKVVVVGDRGAGATLLARFSRRPSPRRDPGPSADPCPPKPGASDLISRFCVDAGAPAPRGAWAERATRSLTSSARVLTAAALAEPAARPGGPVCRAGPAGPGPAGPQGQGTVLGWPRCPRPARAQALLLQRRHGGPPSVRHYQHRVVRVGGEHGASRTRSGRGDNACRSCNSADAALVPGPPRPSVVPGRAAPLCGRVRYGRRLQVRPGVPPRGAGHRRRVFRRPALAVLHGGLFPRRHQHGPHPDHPAHTVGAHRARQAAPSRRRARGQAVGVVARPAKLRPRGQRTHTDVARCMEPQRGRERCLSRPAVPRAHGARGVPRLACAVVVARRRQHPWWWWWRRWWAGAGPLLLHLGHPGPRSLR